MAKQTLADTDETIDGLTILFYAKSGQSYEASKQDILTWIEETELNSHTSGFGLVSDPHAREEVVTVDASEYYCENELEVLEQYFKQVINK